VHFTRTTPEGYTARAGRIDAADLEALTFSADTHPTCYVCGPTPFVDTISDLLVTAGHPSARIRTERFGPTGG
jgi:ferredoxin-NADP reductase